MSFCPISARWPKLCGQRLAADARSGGAFGKSYAALTAGVKRFLASRRADDADDRASNLVRLLSDAR